MRGLFVRIYNVFDALCMCGIAYLVTDSANLWWLLLTLPAFFVSACFEVHYNVEEGAQ